MTHTQIRFIALAGLLLVMVSCTTPVQEVSPPIQTPATFSDSGTEKLPPKWWKAFGDEHLNALIEEALEHNFTLRTAWDRLDQAHAIAAKSGADLNPSLDATAEVGRTVSRTSGSSRRYSNSYSLGLVASYEADLWGRVRATRDAAATDALATQEDLQAAAITISAQIAAAWYELVEQHGQLRLIDAQTNTNGQYLDLILLQFRRGLVSATDVLQQRQLVESNKGERVLVESRISLLEHQLAVLLGKAPGRDLGLTLPEKLPALPPLPDTGLPVEWMRQRPDLRAAELRVHAADQRVAAAIADRFPRLALTAQASTEANKIHHLFDNWLAGLAANLTAPIIDGGQRMEEVRRTEAVAAERLHDYGLALLTALQEVEDALIGEVKQSDYLESLGKQLDLSRKAADQTRENYTKGATTFTAYLVTVLSHQNLQRNYLQAEKARLQLRIDLYRALGGSWPLHRPDSQGLDQDSRSMQTSGDTNG